MSVISVGELRRGVESVRHRGDEQQARMLETWLQSVVEEFRHDILPFETEAAQVWGKLRVPVPEHEIDKQIAATALVYDLTVVTRNAADYRGTGTRPLNPFQQAQEPR